MSVNSGVVDLRQRRRHARTLRVLLGGLVWAALGTAGWRGVERLAGDDDRAAPLRQLADFAATVPHEIELRFATPCRTRIGDPIFVQTADRPLVQVGVITAVRDANGMVLGRAAKRRVIAHSAQAWLYPGAPALGADAQLAWFPSDQSLAWVVQTLLPPAKRVALQREVDALIEAHGEELLAAFAPVVRASLQDALGAVQNVLPAVLLDHRAQLQDLGMAWQEEFVRQELIPLVKSELVPIIERRARPVLTPLGREIWSRVSLWRFGSRWLWDALPLTSGDSVEQEWNRLLKDEALPVLEAHSDELLKLVRDIVVEASANDEVRATLKRGYGRALDDERIHALLWSVFRQAVVENTALHDAVVARWQGEPARRAIDLAGRRLDPTLRRIGDLLLGTREAGIAPELAAVLRNRLLLKDQQWFVLQAGAGGGVEGGGVAPLELPVVVGSEQRDPFLRPGGR